MNRADALAPANRCPPALHTVRRRKKALSRVELASLANLAARFAKGQRQWPSQDRVSLEALVAPVDDVLEHMKCARAPRNSVIHILVLEMHALGLGYAGWAAKDWLSVLRHSEGDFRKRHGASGNCRQYMIALAYLLCDFDRLTELGRFFQYRLAIKVFGREAVDVAAGKVVAEMTKLGFTETHRAHLLNSLFMALLLQRSPRLEDLKVETLRHVAVNGAAFLRRGCATLSRALARMGILETGFDYRIDGRRRPERERRATDDVPQEWVQWCERWRATAAGAASSTTSGFYGLLSCGRWLAATHPEIKGPAEWSRATAIEYTAAVSRTTIGQWSSPCGPHLERRGHPMKPAAKASMLRAARNFFRDLQEWEWIPRRFDPVRALGLPHAIGALIGPEPRVVADDAWAKIMWAGLNLDQTDLATGGTGPGVDGSNLRYPVAMVRALVMLWLFAGLRRDELRRMRIGCIRRQPATGEVQAATCLLDVPVNKTSTAFTKPVDAIVGEAVDAWERERRPHPKMRDAKTGSMVDYLFVHRGRRFSEGYLNRSLIPLLCRKAGVPIDDARGRITSHRARATTASQLFNAREPLGLFELQAWLGHASPESTRHYVAVTPTKLTNAIQRAGYFERNLRTIAVLVDQDAVRSGAAARGKPWRYYDLGHGLCTYDFFDQCPHRMACAKCSFYVPKTSSRAQALEASANLTRMLQQIPLQEAERAAVEDGIQAMTKLVDSLRDTPAPDGRFRRNIGSDR